MQSVLVTPPGAERPDGLQPLADSINAFAAALKTWRDESATVAGNASRYGGVSKVANGAPAPGPGRPEDDDAPY